MKRIAWTEQARQGYGPAHSAWVASIRRIGRLRLRVGDYRLFFVMTGDDAVEVRRVRHRREAYR